MQSPKHHRGIALALVAVGALVALAVFTPSPPSPTPSRETVAAPRLPSSPAPAGTTSFPSLPTPSPSTTAYLAPAPSTTPAGAQHIAAVVDRVVDGDTIIVQLPDGERERVRLIGIDTPESVDPRRPVECLGEEAAKRTQELLAGRRVLLAFDPTQGLRDRYRRLLAYVFRDDGLFVNETLIAEGYAHEYTYATPYTYQAQFKRVQQEAREEQRGLWHPSACANFPKQNERRP